MTYDEAENIINHTINEINRQKRFGIYGSEAKFILYVGRRQTEAFRFYSDLGEKLNGYEYLVVGGKESWVHLAAVV